jgi:probable addiction module antidote protein
MPRARPFNAAKYRDDPRAIAKYLNNALSTGDPVQLTKAIGDMVRAQGVARVSRKSGIERTSASIERLEGKPTQQSGRS